VCQIKGFEEETIQLRMWVRCFAVTKGYKLFWSWSYHIYLRQ
jgi:hypothetical protein